MLKRPPPCLQLRKAPVLGSGDLQTEYGLGLSSPLGRTNQAAYKPRGFPPLRSPYKPGKNTCKLEPFSSQAFGAVAIPPNRFQTSSRLASERVVQRWKERTARVMREQEAEDLGLVYRIGRTTLDRLHGKRR